MQLSSALAEKPPYGRGTGLQAGKNLHLRNNEQANGMARVPAAEGTWRNAHHAAAAPTA
jgi:hypothetical protein